MLAYNSKQQTVYWFQLETSESCPREILNVKNGSLEIWGIFALFQS